MTPQMNLMLELACGPTLHAESGPKTGSSNTVILLEQSNIGPTGWIWSTEPLNPTVWATSRPPEVDGLG